MTEKRSRIVLPIVVLSLFVATLWIVMYDAKNRRASLDRTKNHDERTEARERETVPVDAAPDPRARSRPDREPDATRAVEHAEPKHVSVRVVVDFGDRGHGYLPIDLVATDRDGERFEARTNTTGRASFLVPPAEYTFTIEQRGWSATPVTLACFEPFQSVTLVPHPAVVTGVVYHGGEPAPFTEVYVERAMRHDLEEGERAAAVTNADGRFRLSIAGTAGRHIWAERNGVRSQRKPVNPMRQRRCAVRLDILGIAIAGRVLDPDGRPAAGGTVQVVGVGDTRAGSYELRCPIGSDGSFRIEVPRGGRYACGAYSGEDFYPVTTWVDAPATGSNSVTLHTVAPDPLRGMLVDADGEPIPHASIHATSVSTDTLHPWPINSPFGFSLSRYGSTQADGSFELPLLHPELTYHVTANVDRSFVAAHPGARTRDFVELRTGTVDDLPTTVLEIVFRDAVTSESISVAACSVEMRSSPRLGSWQGPPQTLDCARDDTGSWVVEIPYSQARMALLVTVDGYAPCALGLFETPQSDGRRIVDAPLHRGGSIEVATVGFESRGEVRLSWGDTRYLIAHEKTPADDDGTVRFENLPQGDYWVRAVDGNRIVPARRATVAPQQVTIVEIRSEVE